MGTLDEDMAQEADIAELQENFNEVVEQEIKIDHIEQKNEALFKKLEDKKQKIKEGFEKTNQLKEELKQLTEELNQLKRESRLDSLRPRTSPKKYKFWTWRDKNRGWSPKFATGLNIRIGIHR